MKVSTSTDRRKRAELYRNAARRMEQQSASAWYGACYAIYDFAGKHSAESKAAEADLEFWFGVHARKAGHWINFWGANFDESEVVARDCRVLMLSLMAAMVEAGDA